MCYYEVGLLTGLLNEYTNKNYQVEEVDCWRTGSHVCRFECKVLESEAI